MEPFITLTGKVAPLDRTNVNTDEITPARFLKTIKRTGFENALFANWRFTDPQGKNVNADFVLNQPRYQGVTILLAEDNFGCGSSREHAPWALHDYGFRCLIAPSFADIFYNNCFNNGLLPITLPHAEVRELFAEVEASEGYQLSVDLPAQTVTTPGGRVLHACGQSHKTLNRAGIADCGIRRTQRTRGVKRKRPIRRSNLSGRGQIGVTGEP